MKANASDYIDIFGWEMIVEYFAKLSTEEFKITRPTRSDDDIDLVWAYLGHCQYVKESEKKTYDFITADIDLDILEDAIQKVRGQLRLQRLIADGKITVGTTALIHKPKKDLVETITLPSKTNNQGERGDSTT